MPMVMFNKYEFLILNYISTLLLEYIRNRSSTNRKILPPSVISTRTYLQLSSCQGVMGTRENKM